MGKKLEKLFPEYFQRMASLRSDTVGNELKEGVAAAMTIVEQSKQVDRLLLLPTLIEASGADQTGDDRNDASPSSSTAKRERRNRVHFSADESPCNGGHLERREASVSSDAQPN